MTPAKEVGGDLYDFFLIDEDHLGMVIGDVSGKGVPASLFMMVAASLIRNAAMSGSGPAQTLQTVNAQILARNPEEMFVTVWLGVLEISTGRLTAANAGHEYPALKKAGGHFELVRDRHGFVIGGMEGVRLYRRPDGSHQRIGTIAGHGPHDRRPSKLRRGRPRGDHFGRSSGGAAICGRGPSV